MNKTTAIAAIITKWGGTAKVIILQNINRTEPSSPPSAVGRRRDEGAGLSPSPLLYVPQQRWRQEVQGGSQTEQGIRPRFGASQSGVSGAVLLH